MVQIESQIRRVKGLRTSFLAAGAGTPTLVLIHGGGFDASTISWRLALEPLSTRMRVIAVDLPGYGRSDKPRIRYDLDFYISFLRSFFLSLGLPNVVLCGLSLGGMVSAGFTLRYPAAVRALVLVDSAGLKEAIRWRLTAWIGPRIPGLHTLVSRTAALIPGLLKLFMRNLVHRPERLTDEMAKEIREAILQPGAGYAWESFLRHETSWKGFRNHLSGRLSAIGIPTLLIHGAEDRLVPLQHSIDARDSIESSRLEVFEDCGHWLPREDPDRFVRALFRFFDEIGVGDGQKSAVEPPSE